ncbi:hypothetical protein OU995_26130 [Roseateles sp. SL47]|uniref:hypothetical protein n=1 Tax=Roseateles sp. SL47 TaxID=2995138 RepID=UPI002271D3C0|nr:hypothetical protein [Roseateles sp. SL47]WAC72948.1 hypothetical protein OU995_26130 [Roseateles sp. SL47]
MIPSQIHASSASASASAGATHSNPSLNAALSREVLQQVQENQHLAEALINHLMSNDPAVEKLEDVRQQYVDLCIAVRDNVHHFPETTGQVSAPGNQARMRETALQLPLCESNRHAAVSDKSDLDRVMKHMAQCTQMALADVMQPLREVNNAIKTGLPQEIHAPITSSLDCMFQNQASMLESPTLKDLPASNIRNVAERMLKTAEDVRDMVQTVKTYEQTLFSTSRSVVFYSRFGHLKRQAYQFAALGDRKSFDAEIQKIRDLINKLGVSEATSTDSSV